MKDEKGKIYGIWIVKRYSSELRYVNRTYDWECECRYCGHMKKINGSALRQGRYMHECEKCGNSG